MQTWNINNGPQSLERIEHHTEFVVGLDFNLHLPGQVRPVSDPYITFALSKLLDITNQ